jgi:hypothetical protein
MPEVEILFSRAGLIQCCLADAWQQEAFNSAIIVPSEYMQHAVLVVYVSTYVPVHFSQIVGVVTAEARGDSDVSKSSRHFAVTSRTTCLRHHH